ncbi:MULTISPECIES: PRTRC system protein E [unclassified Pedobacter]|uniref:PRTRC system protein E n=1 Tax=unclassified Pedobacter TaxID=2628915 RepID=UPI001DC0BBFA|nr:MULTISPECIES: PRTRC system protein E [unclassified Pedobacter]CAH0266359.1 hypothetical protein SRABI36_03608 [Pedobacter sp. Bi36]CAH0292663.1 hypothetical protein SRABI126_04102 [Pedobacter sp. Bi126]
MRTNFFQAIQRLNGVGAWVFNITFSAENEMVVSVMLKDKAVNDGKYPIPPMVYRGTPQEIDEGIFDALVQPVEEANGLFANISAYNKGLADAKAKITAKAKSDKSPTEKSVEKNKGGDSAEEKVQDRPKFEDVLAEINKLNAGCKYAEALALLPAAESYPEKKGEIEKLKKELEWKSQQLSLL